MVTDLAGNLFATGSEPEGAVSKVAKYDSELRLIWSFKPTDSPRLTHFRAIVADSDSNLLVTGSFSGGGMRLGPFALTNAAPNEELPFLAKFNNEGRPVWLILVSTDKYAAIQDLGVDSAGSCYFVGVYQARDTGESRSFLSKYSSQGEKLWSRDLSDPPNQIAADVLAANARGDLLVAGHFHGISDSGRSPVLFMGTTLLSAGGDDMFVSKFDSLGSIEWVLTLGSLSGAEGVRGVAWSARGLAEITGNISEPTAFGNLGTIAAEHRECTSPGWPSRRRRLQPCRILQVKE